MTEWLSLSPVGQFLVSCLSHFASWELVLAFLLLKCENCQFFPVQEANYWVGFPRICLYRNVGTPHLQLMSLQLFPALWGKQWSLSLGSLWALGSGEDCIFGTLFGETPAKSYKSYWFWFWVKTSLVAQMVKESAHSVEDPGLIHGLERSPSERDGYPLQYSCLENSMDLVGYMGLQNSQTQLSNSHF